MDDWLTPSARQQTFATFDSMGKALRMIEYLAGLRGTHDDWDGIVRRLIGLRIRVQHGPLGDDFNDKMERLCDAYDAFVARTL